MSWIRIKWPWLILPEHKIAYCYHSKAACTSIVASLAEATGRKDILKEVPIHRVFQGQFVSMYDFWKRRIVDNYFTFTFVRNPFDRLVSCYEDRIKRKNSRGFPKSFHNRMGFEEFINAVQLIYPGNGHYTSLLALDG